MRILLIANPKSGKGVAKRLIPKIEDFFKKNYYDAESYITKKPYDAMKIAKKAAESGKYDIIVSCGGDGTLNEVINGIMMSRDAKKRNKRLKESRKIKEVLLGIIPFGTENVLAQVTGIPFNWLRAARTILDGKIKNIDLGEVIGLKGRGKQRSKSRFFVLMVGIGFDAHVASKVKPMLKKLLGSAAYPLSAFKEIIKYKHPNINILIDGKKKEKGSFVVAGNTNIYGGYAYVTPRAKIDDGLLDVCIFKGRDIASFLRYGLGVLTKSHTSFKDISYIRAKKILVKSTPNVLCHVDCEIFGKTPLEIKVHKSAMEIIVPRNKYR
ncbi:MAG: diacylglycerol kinase family lipid kinase [Candidatus Woesearchaeota archaeon]|nr:diacylglycerol kinase family lipid kinase [Candidatus Woesearchaeota archaeon]